MAMLKLPGTDRLRTSFYGRRIAPPLVLLHELGLEAGMWDDIVTRLPFDLNILAPDLRGHGKTPLGSDAFSMRDLVADVADMLVCNDVQDAMVVGTGIGGILAQALAAEAPQTTRSLVLLSTAPKLETEDRWHARGQKIVDCAPNERAFELFNDVPDGEIAASFNAALSKTDTITLSRYCDAIAQTDLRASTDGLRLPTLGLVGLNDRTTPPDLVREMIEGIPGADFQIIPRAGHFLPYDAAAQTAQAIHDFMQRTGHLLNLNEEIPHR